MQIVTQRDLTHVVRCYGQQRQNNWLNEWKMDENEWMSVWKNEWMKENKKKNAQLWCSAIGYRQGVT